jgi:NAD(P)-dependent dehydrogenase (short-subunit alcohol dehydrogenase family)
MSAPAGPSPSTTNNTTPSKPSPPSIGWQLLRQRPLADTTGASSLAGKTVLVTGANSGLGLAAATKFASLRPARLILAVRNPDAGHDAKNLIAQSLLQLGNNHSNNNNAGDAPASAPVQIDVWPLEMTSYASIAALARRAAAELDRLDVAVLNAGVYEAAPGASAYGWERTVQVNALSTALLALLLLPKLRASAALRSGGAGGRGDGAGAGPAVLQVVASRRAEAVQVTEEMRTGRVLEVVGRVREAGYKPSEQYRVSKFLAMAVVKKLAGLVDPSEVLVTAVCPGGVATNLSRGWTGVVATVVKAVLNALALRTPEYAARSVVSGALLGSEASGKLWYDDELHE